jgi:hypothetical protein
MFKNFINYVKNNSGKALITSNVVLFMGFDSYVFRKQTSPEIYVKERWTPEKYNRYSTYSILMKPFRIVKDHFWIQHIHRTLAEGYNKTVRNDEGIIVSKLSDYGISRDKYSKFLQDFPYSENYLNEIYTGKIYPITSWIVDEFYAYDPDDNDEHERTKNQMKLLQTFGFYKSGHASKNPYFVSNLLTNELRKTETLRNNIIINWCLSQQIENPRASILSKIKEELLSKLPIGFFNPENVLTSFHHRLDDWGSNNNVLISNETYFSNMAKYFPECLSKIHSFEDVLPLYQYQKRKGRELIVENFDKFNKKIQIELCNHELCNYRKEDLSPFVFTFVKEKSNLIDLLKQKYIDFENLSKIVNSKSDILELIYEGHYQLHDSIPIELKPELTNRRDVNKLLMTQKDLNNETVRDLVIIYEKHNTHLTRTEQDSFIKTYQPKYFKWFYSLNKC